MNSSTLNMNPKITIITNNKLIHFLIKIELHVILMITLVSLF